MTRRGGGCCSFYYVTQRKKLFRMQRNLELSDNKEDVNDRWRWGYLVRKEEAADRSKTWWAPCAVDRQEARSSLPHPCTCVARPLQRGKPIPFHFPPYCFQN